MRFRFQRSSFHVVADGTVPLDPDVFAQARDAPLIFLYVLGGDLFASFKSHTAFIMIHGCNCWLERVSSVLRARPLF